MKLAVIGANGRSGKIFIEHALHNGHEITAGVFHGELPADMPIRQVQCDATSAADLAALIAGQDAVVSLIGHVKGSPPDVQARAIQALVGVMQTQGVKRVVSLTGTGVRFPGDKITLVDRFLNMAVSIVDKPRVQDGRDHVRILQQSDLDWTVIRVLKLQNTEPGSFSLREHGPTKPYVSREEVAAAILQVLEQGSFVHQAPIISPVQAS
jgi:putative NADH-flavin reductase